MSLLFHVLIQLNHDHSFPFKVYLQATFASDFQNLSSNVSLSYLLYFCCMHLHFLASLPLNISSVTVPMVTELQQIQDILEKKQYLSEVESETGREKTT